MTEYDRTRSIQQPALSTVEALLVERTLLKVGGPLAIECLLATDLSDMLNMNFLQSVRYA